MNQKQKKMERKYLREIHNHKWIIKYWEFDTYLWNLGECHINEDSTVVVRADDGTIIDPYYYVNSLNRNSYRFKNDDERNIYLFVDRDNRSILLSDLDYKKLSSCIKHDASLDVELFLKRELKKVEVIREFLKYAAL